MRSDKPGDRAERVRLASPLARMGRKELAMMVPQNLGGEFKGGDSIPVEMEDEEEREMDQNINLHVDNAHDDHHFPG